MLRGKLSKAVATGLQQSQLMVFVFFFPLNLLMRKCQLVGKNPKPQTKVILLTLFSLCASWTVSFFFLCSLNKVSCS